MVNSQSVIDSHVSSVTKQTVPAGGSDLVTVLRGEKRNLDVAKMDGTNEDESNSGELREENNQGDGAALTAKRPKSDVTVNQSQADEPHIIEVNVDMADGIFRIRSDGPGRTGAGETNVGEPINTDIFAVIDRLRVRFPGVNPNVWFERLERAADIDAEATAIERENAWRTGTSDADGKEDAARGDDKRCNTNGREGGGPEQGLSYANPNSRSSSSEIPAKRQKHRSVAEQAVTGASAEGDLVPSIKATDSVKGDVLLIQVNYLREKFPDRDPNVWYARLERANDVIAETSVIAKELRRESDHYSRDNVSPADIEIVSTLLEDKDIEVKQPVKAVVALVHRIRSVTPAASFEVCFRRLIACDNLDLEAQNLAAEFAVPQIGDDFFEDDDDDRPGPSNRGAKRSPGLSEFLQQDQRHAVELILQMFPDCDPFYVVKQIAENGLEVGTLVDRMTSTSYPKLKDKLAKERQERRRQECSDPSMFNTEEFLKTFPDPEEYFGNTERPVSELYRYHAITQIQNDFPNIDANFLEARLREHNNHYYPALRSVREAVASYPLLGYSRKGKKSALKVPYLSQPRQAHVPFPDEVDELFYRELQYVLNQARIREYLQQTAQERQRRIDRARQHNELGECPCCLSDDVLPEEFVNCADIVSWHRYCQQCTQRHAEEVIGQGRHRVTCLSDGCTADIPLATLRRVLQSRWVDVVLRRSQQEEIRQAGIDNMETCPFCDFAIIMDSAADDDRVFRCQNPDCLKQSCRLCKEPNHVPLKCNEVERADETAMRTFVENRMAEALIRTCPKCGKRIIKENGCNKMACPCGVYWCYVCRKELNKTNPYSHFNSSACRLFTQMHELHDAPAKEAGVKARDEYLAKHPEVQDAAKRSVNVEKLVDAGPAQNADRPGARAFLGQFGPMGVNIELEYGRQERNRGFPLRRYEECLAHAAAARTANELDAALHEYNYRRQIEERLRAKRLGDAGGRGRGIPARPPNPIRNVRPVAELVMRRRQGRTSDSGNAADDQRGYGFPSFPEQSNFFSDCFPPSGAASSKRTGAESGDRAKATTAEPASRNIGHSGLENDRAPSTGPSASGAGRSVGAASGSAAASTRDPDELKQQVKSLRESVRKVNEDLITVQRSSIRDKGGEIDKDMRRLIIARDKLIKRQMESEEAALRMGIAEAELADEERVDNTLTNEDIQESFMEATRAAEERQQQAEAERAAEVERSGVLERALVSVQYHVHVVSQAQVTEDHLRDVMDNIRETVLRPVGQLEAANAVMEHVDNLFGEVARALANRASGCTRVAIQEYAQDIRNILNVIEVELRRMLDNVRAEIAARPAAGVTDRRRLGDAGGLRAIYRHTQCSMQQAVETEKQLAMELSKLDKAQRQMAQEMRGATTFSGPRRPEQRLFGRVRPSDQIMKQVRRIDAEIGKLRNRREELMRDYERALMNENWDSDAGASGNSAGASWDPVGKSANFSGDVQKCKAVFRDALSSTASAQETRAGQSPSQNEAVGSADSDPRSRDLLQRIEQLHDRIDDQRRRFYNAGASIPSVVSGRLNVIPKQLRRLEKQLRSRIGLTLDRLTEIECIIEYYQTFIAEEVENIKLGQNGNGQSSSNTVSANAGRVDAAVNDDDEVQVIGVFPTQREVVPTYVVEEGPVDMDVSNGEYKSVSVKPKYQNNEQDGVGMASSRREEDIIKTNRQEEGKTEFNNRSSNDKLSPTKALSLRKSSAPLPAESQASYRPVTWPSLAHSSGSPYPESAALHEDPWPLQIIGPLFDFANTDGNASSSPLVVNTRMMDWNEQFGLQSRTVSGNQHYPASAVCTATGQGQQQETQVTPTSAQNFVQINLNVQPPAGFGFSMHQVAQPQPEGHDVVMDQREGRQE